MKHLPLLLLLLFFTSPAFAQLPMVTTPPTLPISVIDGVAPGRAGKTIGVYTSDDYITNTERLLAETTVSDSGRFHLAFDLEKTAYVFLRCNKVKGFVFAEPNKTLLVEMPNRDSVMMINPDLEYTADVTFFNDDSTNMNNLAIDYNQRFMKFWNKSILDIYHPILEYRQLDSFRVAMNNHYKNVSNAYFLPWMNYSIASLEDATYNTEKVLYETFLLHKPVQYNNEQYMGFFNGFFKNYVYQHSMKKDGADIRPAINQFGTYEALMNAMKTVRLLDADDTLRELVMLKGLYELYDNPAYVPRNIIAIAEQASTQSKIPEHRQIARNMITQFTKLEVGTAAPGFTAYDRKGKAVTPLQDFHGKYVFLHFYTSWNAHALQEMKLLIDLQKKYGKKIAFVSVSLDQDTAAYKKFLAANPKYNWTMLHYNFNEQLKEDYQLFAYPAYFLIDDQGKFFEAPAESPEGNLEYKLWRIVNPRRTEEGKVPGQR